MPPLSSLTELYFYESLGLNEWTTFPKNLTNSRLKRLDLTKNEIHNTAMDRILNWAVEIFANSLTVLDISENNLTIVPHKISSFSKLEELYVNYQKPGITTIPKDSLHFFVPVLYLDASSNKIPHIEPGTFQGYIQ